MTEYVRTGVQIGKRKIDGIRYNSSRHHAATALVLFADRSNLILDKAERPDFYRTDERWLRLTKATEVKVVDKDIRGWAAKQNPASRCWRVEKSTESVASLTDNHTTMMVIGARHDHTRSLVAVIMATMIAPHDRYDR